MCSIWRAEVVVPTKLLVGFLEYCYAVTSLNSVYLSCFIVSHIWLVPRIKNRTDIAYRLSLLEINRGTSSR